jgi:hypothetical protein
MASIGMRFQLRSFDNIVIITKILLVAGNFLTILVSQFCNVPYLALTSENFL